MAENALDIELREGVGKGVARKLRAAGRIPAVCYGKGAKTIPLALDPAQLRKLLEQSETGINTLLHLRGGGGLEGKTVLVRDLQRDPVRGAYLHADLYAVNLQQTVEVSVPIHLRGKAMGVELGGILDQALREIELECLPLAIPSEVVIDVSALDVGDSLHVRDIALPEGVTLVSDPELSVVSVVAPKVEEEPEAVEAVEGAEPGAEGEPAEGAEGEKPAEESEEKSSDS